MMHPAANFTSFLLGESINPAARALRPKCATLVAIKLFYFFKVANWRPWHFANSKKIYTINYRKLVLLFSFFSHFYIDSQNVAQGKRQLFALGSGFFVSSLSDEWMCFGILRPLPLFTRKYGESGTKITPASAITGWMAHTAEIKRQSYRRIHAIKYYYL